MKTLQSLAALIAGGCITASALVAETAPKLPGSKSNLTLTATATSQAGDFFVTDAKRESDYEKGIEYSDPADPLGHDQEDAHYYTQRITTKTQNFGTSVEPNILTVSVDHEEKTRLITEKFTNANFLQELIDREFLPITSPAGYKLVVVFPADGEGLFFVEKAATRTVPASIYYVGREGSGYSSVAGDALRINLYDEVEAFYYKSKRTYKHKKQTATTPLVIDEVGTRVQSETVSGKINTWVSLFPTYWDYESEGYVGTGTALYYGGLASFTAKMAEKGGFEVFYPTSLNLPVPATSGYFQDEAYSEGSYYDEDRNSLVTGSAVVGGSAVIDDITPYLDAMPESLSELKQSIIDSYGFSEGDASEMLGAAL